ncbi:malectin domain-containing carbohydrate-binding protein [Streptomyces sp. NPDC001389]|uniref:malectin domain-containing carbohydrate-binding protein n=1 Tax=Streptomyces sp. NPDC001389 TaxID=3364569 RepID=UPI0036865883
MPPGWPARRRRASGRARPDKRVFDVMAEGARIVPSLDVALEAGAYTAVTRTCTAKVTDGALDLRFVTHGGFGGLPAHSIRVTDRPAGRGPGRDAAATSPAFGWRAATRPRLPRDLFGGPPGPT